MAKLLLVEDETELVTRCHRGQDDPARRSARDVQARRLHSAEVKGSHAVYVSQPQAVASLIEQAAKGLGGAR